MLFKTHRAFTVIIPICVLFANMSITVMASDIITEIQPNTMPEIESSDLNTTNNTTEIETAIEEEAKELSEDINTPQENNISSEDNTAIPKLRDKESLEDLKSPLIITENENTAQASQEENKEALTTPDKNIPKELTKPLKTANEMLNIKEQRQHIRLKAAELKNPIVITKSEDYTSVIDISRGGVALRHMGTLKAGDVTDIEILYKDVHIKTQVVILATTENRASAKFIDSNKETVDQILYLSILLEADNNMLPTKFTT